MISPKPKASFEPLYFKTILFADGARMFSPPSPPPGTAWQLDRSVIANPYGVLAVGLEWELTPRWSTRIELRHESSIASRMDLGENSAGVFVRWRLGRWRD